MELFQRSLFNPGWTFKKTTEGRQKLNSRLLGSIDLLFLTFLLFLSSYRSKFRTCNYKDAMLVQMAELDYKHGMHMIVLVFPHHCSHLTTFTLTQVTPHSLRHTQSFAFGSACQQCYPQTDSSSGRTRESQFLPLPGQECWSRLLVKLQNMSTVDVLVAYAVSFMYVH